MQSWQVALLVISAVFVGMWIPVSIQLFATLRSGQKFFETMSRRGGQTLTEVSTTVAALNQTITDVGEVAHAAAQIKDSIRIISSIAAAVGPAVVALVRALREPAADDDHPTNHEAASKTGHSAPVKPTETEKESTP